MPSRDSSDSSLTLRMGWGASLLLLLGIFVHRGTQSTDKTADKKEGQSKGAPASPVDASSPKSNAGSLAAAPHYLEPLAKFVGRSRKELCQGEISPIGEDEEVATPRDALAWVRRWGPNFAKYDPQFLIAALPDPDRSRSGYKFDLWLEASTTRRGSPGRTRIGKDVWARPLFFAVETFGGQRSTRRARSGSVPRRAGLSIDSFGAGRPGEDACRFAGGGCTDGVTQQTCVTCLPRHRGLVRFGKGTQDRIISSRKMPRNGIRLIAPVFSGSQHSLQNALQGWWTKRKKLLEETYEKCKIEAIGTSAALRPERFFPDYKLSNGQPFLSPLAPRRRQRDAPHLVPSRSCADKCALLRYILDLHDIGPCDKGKVRIAHLQGE